MNDKDRIAIASPRTHLKNIKCWVP